MMIPIVILLKGTLKIVLLYKTTIAPKCEHIAYITIGGSMLELKVNFAFTSPFMFPFNMWQPVLLLPLYI